MTLNGCFGDFQKLMEVCRLLQLLTVSGAILKINGGKLQNYRHEKLHCQQFWLFDNQ